MSKWELVKLGDVATIVSGSTPRTSVEEYWGGEFCWVTPAEIQDTDVVISNTARKITAKAIADTGLNRLPKGTVLLSSRAPIGKVAITGVEMYCNQGFKNLICSDRILNKFLFWFLKGKTDFLNSLGRGATFKEISKRIVEEIQVPLPPLETQRKIAKTLDIVSEMLTMRKQQLVELDNLIKSTFYDMFGDPVINEKGWAKKPLGESCSIITGNTPSRRVAENYGEYIEWIKSDNITESLYITPAKEYLSDIGFAKCRYVDNPTILMTCIAGSLNSIGNVAITDRKVAFNQQINAIIPDGYNLFFLYSMLQLSKGYIHSTINMSLKGILSKGKLSQLEFIIPPIEFQRQFGLRFNKIAEMKDTLTKASEQVQLLFDSLMSRYFE